MLLVLILLREKLVWMFLMLGRLSRVLMEKCEKVLRLVVMICSLKVLVLEM